jgi:putative membrane protein insertion efficiency factor
LKVIINLLNKIFSYIFIGLIYFYKTAISPHTPASCRFVPTCSQYALEAIKKYGPFKGGWLALRRILRCNPWGKSGYDPVP